MFDGLFKSKSGWIFIY